MKTKTSIKKQTDVKYSMTKLPYFRHPLQDAGYKKNILIGKTVIRNSHDHTIKYEELYSKKESGFTIECYKDLQTQDIIVFRSIFDNKESFLFTDFNEMSSFVKESEKYIYLSDFIKNSFSLIKKNCFPLFYENSPKLYFNPIKKIYYFGINYFLIYNNEYLKNNNTCTLYYSNSNLKEHNLNIIKRKIKGTIIYNAHKKYDLLAAGNNIRNIPDDYKIIKKFSNNNFQFKTVTESDDLKIITEKNIYNFFLSAVMESIYVPVKPKKMKSFIIENPISFLEILEKIEILFLEELYV